MTRDKKGERVFPGREWEVAAPESQGVDPAKLGEAICKLEEISRDKVEQTGCEEGATQAMVVRHGRVIWRGPDVGNFHTVWSCSKSFVSMSFGLLIDDGKCTLDTVAADVLPSLGKHYPGVTLRQFATFTSGYNGRQQGNSVGYFEPGPPAYPSGKFFRYSQETDQLANLLTRIAGEPLRDLFRRRIAEPIGLDPAGWRWGDWGEVDGLVVCGGSGSFDRGISITARQMARLGWLLVNRGNWNGRQLLSRAYLEEMTTPQVAATVPPHDPKAWYVRLPGSYGVNIWLNGVTPDGRRMWPDAPPRTCAIQGNMNNICFAVPEWDLVYVREGSDGRINNNRNTEVFALLGEALEDLP